MFLAIGSTAMTIPIFMTLLTKRYGWSHACVSTLPTLYLLMLSLVAPITRWLLEPTGCADLFADIKGSPPRRAFSRRYSNPTRVRNKTRLVEFWTGGSH